MQYRFSFFSGVLYTHTCVYFYVCVSSRGLAVGIRLHSERRRRKKWFEKRKEMIFGAYGNAETDVEAYLKVGIR